MNARSATLTRLIHGLCCLFLLLAAFASPLSQAQPALAAPAISGLTVDRSDDANVGGCTLAPNDCTLRGAINTVNAGPIDQTILFSPVVTLVALINPLPAIVVTGTWVVGNAGVPRLDAIFMADGNIFSVTAPTARITALSIVNGHPFTDGIFADIWVAGGQGIEIDSNFLGTLAPGPDVTNCTPNPDGGSQVAQNSGYGVFVDKSVTGGSGLGNGSVYIHGNTIACHDGHGIVLNGADFVHIGEDISGSADGNFIGANVDGVVLGNGTRTAENGIEVVAAGSNGAKTNVIRANTIVNNGAAGIRLSGTGTNNSSSTTGNLIAGNRIGLDAFGTHGNGAEGIFLGSGAFLNIIGGAADADRNVISGNGGDGIRVIDSNGTGILGNYIGTNLAGAGRAANGGSGVEIDNGDATLVGAYFLILIGATRENVISGNALQGVWVHDNSDATFIVGNKIGVSAGGGAAVPNGSHGILLDAINTSAVITGNVVSGNNSAGIKLLASHGVSITRNYLGTNAAGTAALPNGEDGVALRSASNFNVVGGSSVYQRNVISGNSLCGIYGAENSDFNFIDFNLIGLNAAGTGAIGNGWDGICLYGGSSNNQIGHSGAGFSQYLSGNGLSGITLNAASNNGIENTNGIGIAVTGAAAGNRTYGVFVVDSANMHIYANNVANNGRAGVAQTGNSSIGNDLGPNSVSANGGLPIDLGDDGPTANDPGDIDTGTNNLLNYPVITASSANFITGTVCFLCTVYIYRALGDPGRPGGGGDYLGAAFADGGGNWNYALPGGMTARDVTMQAKDGAANTSEFSPRPILFLPLVKR